MTTRAKFFDAHFWNFSAVIRFPNVAIGWVVTVETELVRSVVENDVLMFDPYAIGIPLGLQRLVAFHAVVSPSHFFEIESVNFPRRGGI